MKSIPLHLHALLIALFTQTAFCAEKKPAPETRTARPKNSVPQALHASALVAFQEGRIDEAQAAYLKILQIEKDNIPASINLSLILQRKKLYPESESYLQKILHKDPQNATAWLILGIGAYERENTDASIAHLAQAVLHAPKNAEAHHYFGIALGRKGWYAAGEDELRRAIELKPDLADAHYNLAMLYMERHPASTELARRHYQKALELGASKDPALAARIGE